MFRYTKKSWDLITNQAIKVNELMDEISTASEEQAQGVEQVNRSMTQMEKPNNIDRIQALLYYLSNRFNT